MTVLILSSLTAIVVSFLCSMMEAVLLSTNKVKLETDKQKGLPYALTMDKLRKNINRPIAAILILNTIAHTAGATIAGGAFSEVYGDRWIWLFSILFTFVILFGTELLPKFYGVAHAGNLATVIAKPLYWLTVILRPLVVVTELFARLLVSKKTANPEFSLEDIQSIVKVAESENLISKAQQDIMVKTSHLKRRKIDEIMLPIQDVIFFNQDIPAEKYFDLAEKHLHTRYPVSTSNSPQDIIGYFNFKEIALARDNLLTQNLRKFIRPIHFANRNTSISRLLQELNSKRYHLAIVKDEDGKNIGMITLEDIVEEIVGEIEDEFDVQQT